MTVPNRRRNEAFVIIAAYFTQTMVLIMCLTAYLLIRRGSTDAPESERRVGRKRKRNSDAYNAELLEKIRGIVKEVTDSFERAVSRLNDDDIYTDVVRILSGFPEPLTVEKRLRVCHRFASNRLMMRLFLIFDGSNRVEMVREILRKP